VHHGPAPEKVYPGPVNAWSYKWLLETLGFWIDPLGDSAEPRPRCIAACAIARLPQRPSGSRTARSYCTSRTRAREKPANPPVFARRRFRIEILTH
jgi:hypothetical protein